MRMMMQKRLEDLNWRGDVWDGHFYTCNYLSLYSHRPSHKVTDMKRRKSRKSVQRGAILRSNLPILSWTWRLGARPFLLGVQKGRVCMYIFYMRSDFIRNFMLYDDTIRYDDADMNKDLCKCRRNISMQKR